MQRRIKCFALLLGCLLLLLFAPTMHTAQAQKKQQKTKSTANTKSQKRQKNKLKVFDFTGLDVAGQLRAPQLLYFLDRASFELQRASLEQRSFIPEMIRSVDEEDL